MNPPNPARVQKTCVALVFCITFVLSVYNMHFRPWMYDDAFIGFRIAKNLSLGNGLVYNAGERVMTSSTTLYVVLNGIIWKLFSDHAINVILYLNVIWHCLTCCLLFGIVVKTVKVRSDSDSDTITWIAGLFAALFYACSNAVGTVVTSGMETQLYAFFICLAFFLYLRGKDNLAIGFSTIPFLIRPEGCFVAAALMLCVVVEKRKIQLSHVVILTAIVVPFLAALYLYYGTVLPQSIAAKKMLAIDRVGEITEFLKAYFFSLKRLPLGFLFFTGFYYCIRFNRRMLPFVIWGVMYGSFFSLATRWWGWYKPPFYMMYSCMIALGMFSWSRMLWMKMDRPRWAVSGVSVLSILLVAISFDDQCKTLNATTQWYTGMLREAPHIAKLIEQNSTKDQIITLEPLGLIGYYAFDRRFEDYPGLCSPTVVTSLRKLHRNIDINLRDYGALQIISNDVKPTLFVLRQEEYKINKAKGTLENYRVASRLPAEWTVAGHPEIADFASFYILSRMTEAAAVQ